MSCFLEQLTFLLAFDVGINKTVEHLEDTSFHCLRIFKFVHELIFHLVQFLELFHLLFELFVLLIQFMRVVDFAHLF